jgi:hypothetical protein
MRPIRLKKYARTRHMKRKGVAPRSTESRVTLQDGLYQIVVWTIITEVVIRRNFTTASNCSQGYSDSKFSDQMSVHRSVV